MTTRTYRYCSAPTWSPHSPLCLRHRPSLERRQLWKDRASRGYGQTHKKLRQRLAGLVASGQAICARCGRPIAPGETFDLGHVDVDKSRYAGPEHRRCNRLAGGKRGAAVTNARWAAQPKRVSSRSGNERRKQTSPKQPSRQPTLRTA
jgi:hypothetical protein